MSIEFKSKKYLDVEEIQKVFGVGRTFVYLMTRGKKGKIKKIKVGRKYYFSEAALESFFMKKRG